ncbi:hypothetical protein HDV00_001004 [Rhizophlyctis rosea]|nr:hypothetical protein HDV00_001004 [Rhizophlyctis rosea]
MMMTGHPSTASAEATRRKNDPTFTHNEYFKGETLVRPYYDWDAKLAPGTTDEEFQQRIAEHKEEFTRLVDRLHPGDEKEYASRHGIVKVKQGKGAPIQVKKVSHRCWVMGKKIRCRDIPVRARRILGLGAKENHKHLDLTVYKDAEQLLSAPHACKDTDVVKRHLRPADPRTSPGTLLVQNVGPNDVLVEETGTVGALAAVVKRGWGRPRKDAPSFCPGRSDSSAGGGAKGKMVGEGEWDQVKDKEVLSGLDYVEVLQDASDCFGREFRMQETLSSIIVIGQKTCFIFPTRDRWCILKVSAVANMRVTIPT